MENKTKPLRAAGWRHALAAVLLTTSAFTIHAQRINHEGRILGPAPFVTTPTLFNTPAADAIVSAMQIMPRDSAWNEDVSQRPVHANSSAMISQIISDLSASRRTLRPFYEMNYVLVPDNQPRLTIPFFNYPDESDLDGGTFPERQLSDPAEHAHRNMAAGNGKSDAPAMAAGREQHGRGSARDHCRAGRRFDLGDMAYAPHAEWMGGLERREVRSQLERVATRGMDFRGRGRAAHVSGRGPLR